MGAQLSKAAAALGLLALAAVGATAAAQQQPVFRATVDRVRLDALVTAGSGPLPGLSAADFEVLDNGVPQKVEVAATAGDVTVALVVDTSGSVEGPRLEQLIAASEAVLRLLGPGDTASLITFSDRMALIADAARSPAAVRAALAGARAAGRTAMWDALFAGLALAARDSGRSLVILFTDGIDNASWLTEARVTGAVKRAESVVYAVCPIVDVAEDTWDGRAMRATLTARQNLLRRVAGQTGGRLLDTEWSAALTGQFAAIMTEFRSRYLLHYEPAGVGRHDGWHRVDVRVKGRSAKVQVRPGYYASGPGQGG